MRDKPVDSEENGFSLYPSAIRNYVFPSVPCCDRDGRDTQRKEAITVRVRATERTAKLKSLHTKKSYEKDKEKHRQDLQHRDKQKKKHVGSDYLYSIMSFRIGSYRMGYKGFSYF